MPTRRQTISFDDWTWEAIENLRLALGHRSRAHTIKYLLEMALRMHDVAIEVQRMRLRKKK